MPTPATATGIIHIEMLCTPAKSNAVVSIGIDIPPTGTSSNVSVQKSIDLILVGDIDKSNLDDLVMKTESYIKRKIRTFVITQTEYKNMKNIFQDRSKLLLWESDKGSKT